MRHALLAALLAATALPATALAADADPGASAGSECRRVGDISRVYEDVHVVRGGRSLLPVAGETLCLFDRVVTGRRGVAELKFPDGSAITVGKESEFVVNSWKQRRLLTNEATFELVRGAFRAVTGTITQRRHRFEVRTAIATVGVRGTDFWGGTSLTPDALEVVMLEGKGVYVENDTGRIELTTAGTGTTVEMNRTPGEPKAWSPEKLARAVETITP